MFQWQKSEIVTKNCPCTGIDCVNIMVGKEMTSLSMHGQIFNGLSNEL